MIAVACPLVAHAQSDASAPGAAGTTAAAPDVSAPAPAPDANAAPADAPPAQAANAGAPPPPTYDTSSEAPAAQPGASNHGGSDDAGAYSGSLGKRSLIKNMWIALGGRMGYALPMGDFAQDRALDEIVAGAVPLIFDASLRFKNGTEAGLYLQVAFGASGEVLDRGCSDCSVFGARLGVQLNQHLAPEATFDPWVGLGLGVEALTVSESRILSGLRVTSSTHYRALPELTAQMGLDIGGLPFALGPFASFSLAQYSDVDRDVTCQDFRCSGSTVATGGGTIQDGALHYWLQMGVRGVYTL